jgi:hypothetical protein
MKGPENQQRLRGQSLLPFKYQASY